MAPAQTARRKPCSVISERCSRFPRVRALLFFPLRFFKPDDVIEEEPNSTEEEEEEEKEEEEGEELWPGTLSTADIHCAQEREATMADSLEEHEMPSLENRRSTDLLAGNPPPPANAGPIGWPTSGNVMSLASIGATLWASVFTVGFFSELMAEKGGDAANEARKHMGIVAASFLGVGAICIVSVGIFATYARVRDVKLLEAAGILAQAGCLLSLAAAFAVGYSFVDGVPAKAFFWVIVAFPIACVAFASIYKACSLCAARV
ncbi:hypothetical protein B0T16DRAFT_386062 [Cercophora newfieldiana]|uniref:Uncharacterized protein n=1 Tax=Cercophora newfieldiana TaxID=92897 RepID=A0AA40D281_9PEZI|nr:hypothetical protein B0T16DRAFT_386062 [Cercophora newfieldiana]